MLFLARADLVAAENEPLLKLTLREAVQLVLHQNPQVQIARISLALSEQDRNLARAALLPQLGAEVSESANDLRLQCQVDIGIWMSREVFADKLALRTSRNPEAAWNLRNWPEGFVEGEENRLFVACEGRWIGYFKLAPDMLLNRADSAAPYTLLFDTRTWTAIESAPVRPFRGFTYNVPSTLESKPNNDIISAATDRSPAH